MSSRSANKFPDDMRAKAVDRFLAEEKNFPSRYAAAKVIASEYGCSGSTLLSWITSTESTGKGKKAQKTASVQKSAPATPNSKPQEVTGPASFDELMDSAAQLRAQGNLEAAADQYRAATALDTRNVGPLVFLARVLRDLGALDKAEEAFQQVLVKRPESFEALRALGELALRRDAGAVALPLLAKAFQLNPDDARVKRNLASLALAQGDLALAEQAYGAMSDTPVEMVRGLRTTAAQLLAHRDHEAARRCFAAALQVQPGDVALELGLVRCLRNLRRFDEAQAAVTSLMAHAPESREILREQATLLEAAGDTDGALAVFRKARETFGEDSAIDAAIVRCLAKTGKLEAARAGWRARLATDPDDADALKALAGLAENAGNAQEAYALYSKALTIDPKDHGLRIHLARRYTEYEPSVKLEDVYRSAVAAGYRAPAALVGLGGIEARSGNLEQAVALFSEAQERGDKSIRVKLALATAHQKLRHLSESETLYREVLAEEATSTAALAGLARVLVASGRAGEAIDLFGKVLEQDPEDAVTRLALARAYRANRQFEQALSQCDLLAARSETRADAEHERILCLQAEGRQPESFRPN